MCTRRRQFGREEGVSMILYQGSIYKNSEQSRLLKSLKEDSFETLKKPEGLNPKSVINACDKLTKKVIEGKFDDLIKPLLVEFDIPFETFSQYVMNFTKESLEKKMRIELGDDYQNLAPLNHENSRKIYPLGILFHIAAGNLDVLPAYSVIEGLLVGNINVLKLPSGDKGVSVELLSALIEIEPKLKEYIYVFDVPSVEVETLSIFADLADAVIVWGGDEAVKAARNMAKPNTKIIEWGHKLSFAYASLDANDEELKLLAKNIVMTNQLLCSSAQGIFVDTNDRALLDRFAERFYHSLLEIQQTHHEVPFSVKSKNAVEIYYEEMVSSTTGKKIWKKDGVSVVTSDDKELELSLLFRNVWVKMLPFDNIVSTLKPYKNYLQTASILAPNKRYDDYLRRLISAGVVRVKKPNEMSEYTLGESHDGAYPLRLYTRVVEVYRTR